jgi:FkbM family methyltransferase
MRNNLIHFFKTFLSFFSKNLFPFNEKIKIWLEGSRKLRTLGNRTLYKTRFGDFFWLNPDSFVDKSIIDHGVFEDESTSLVKKIVKKSGIVLDVGANIGYYSVLLSKLIGKHGVVYAFEPTRFYRNILAKNLIENKISNCVVVESGLSDKVQKLDIFITKSSATIHPTTEKLLGKEKISLTTLDRFVKENNIKKIDFIKIDVDGHEPAILKGGLNSIKKFRPKILLEISPLHYLKYGTTAWDFYNFLKTNRLRVIDIETMKEVDNLDMFLIKFGNFSNGKNILIR